MSNPFDLWEDSMEMLKDLNFCFKKPSNKVDNNSFYVFCELLKLC
jgi:hypothetical protein